MNSNAEHVSTFFAPAGVWAFGDGRRCVLVGKTGREAQFRQDHTALLKAIGRSGKGSVELYFLTDTPGRPASFFEAMGPHPHREDKDDRTRYAVRTDHLVDVLKLAEQHRVYVGQPPP